MSSNGLLGAINTLHNHMGGKGHQIFYTLIKDSMAGGGVEPACIRGNGKNQTIDFRRKQAGAELCQAQIS